MFDLEMDVEVGRTVVAATAQLADVIALILKIQIEWFLIYENVTI